MIADHQATGQPADRAMGLPSGRIAPQGIPPVIDLDGVAKTYPGATPVHALHPVTVAIGRGEYVTVVGPSGSGKSTLLNLLGLLDRPSEGTYRLDGIDTGDLGEHQRTALRGHRIGFVFQSFHLLVDRSAVENVGLGMVYQGVPRAERIERARGLLDRVGLSHRADAQAGVLSGGERQRVAIARALVSRPSVLLCDEPTGALDSTTGNAVLSLIDDLHAEGITVIVITHDLSVAARGERTLHLADGRVSESAA